jgi:hypothetical protein
LCLTSLLGRRLRRTASARMSTHDGECVSPVGPAPQHSSHDEREIDDDMDMDMDDAVTPPYDAASSGVGGFSMVTPPGRDECMMSPIAPMPCLGVTPASSRSTVH